MHHCIQSRITLIMYNQMYTIVSSLINPSNIVTEEWLPIIGKCTEIETFNYETFKWVRSVEVKWIQKRQKLSRMQEVYSNHILFATVRYYNLLCPNFHLMVRLL